MTEEKRFEIGDRVQFTGTIENLINTPIGVVAQFLDTDGIGIYEVSIVVNHLEYAACPARDPRDDLEGRGL